MASTTPEQYGLYIIKLNPHLFINNEIAATTTDFLTNITQAVRKAPIFLCNSELAKQRLHDEFKFSDAYFEDHHINYPVHIIEKRRICSFSHSCQPVKIIDARFLWGNGFYHFITEVLPAVLEINKPDCAILVKRCPFAERVFRWFGVENPLIYEMPATADVIYRMPMIECGLPSPRKLELMRSIAGTKLSFRKEIGVAIFREENRRRILNFDEVITTLRRIFPDVEWHIYNRQPIEEAAELFSKAKYVFAPHGAGLSNIIFCPKSTVIIELIDLYAPNLCYWHLSEMLGLAHYMIPLFAEYHQFQVDCEQLEGLLLPLHQLDSSEQNP
jgi:hypothetical protein